MKKLSTAFIVLGALIATAPAFAADMALKAAPPPAPVWSWNGWYAGLNVGGSFGNASDSVSFAATGAPFGTGSSSSHMDGVIGGGQLGYNWQSGSWLYGLEADFQGTGQRGTGSQGGVIGFIAGIAVVPVTGVLSDQEKMPWFGTVRGRIGLLATPTWLLYATGGLAYAHISSNENFTIGAVTATSNFGTDRAGWTVGGGLEGVIGNNWTAKLEYLYMDFGTFNNTFPTIAPFPALALSTHITDNIVRVGVNYHFH
jgi:outer membrane immunogenic protein